MAVKRKPRVAPALEAFEQAQQPTPPPAPPPRPFAQQIEQLEMECQSAYMGEHATSEMVRLSEPTASVRCCGRCYAWVDSHNFDAHVEWHVRLEIGR